MIYEEAGNLLLDNPEDLMNILFDLILILKDVKGIAGIYVFVDVI